MFKLLHLRNNTMFFFLSKMYMLDKLYSSLSDYLHTYPENILQNKKLINIANKLSAFYNSDFIKIPQLVVVGTQSSGKSSLLNAITQMDILPTGKNMVTRTPIKLELLNTTNQQINIQFGYYHDGIFKSHANFNRKTLTTNDEEIIRTQIEEFTHKYAGTEKNISYKEIVIRIISPEVPNLTLVDLPGLVMVACTDQGQPEDIKNQIRDLIKHYITQSNTIIMGILPARCDIEVDSALELIKSFDPKGERTIGILTKIDLMNENTDISSYLTGDISNDLKLHYGYFAIKNKNGNEITYNEHNSVENNFFNNHSVYGAMDKSYMGITNLSIYLSNILLNQIQNLMPSIKSQLECQLLNVNNELNKIGNTIIVDDNNKSFMFNYYISEFVKTFNESINNISNQINYGNLIKDIFTLYRDDLNNIKAFNNSDNDAKLMSIIKTSEGNHMYFQTSTIQIVEKCINDKDIKCIYKLKEPSFICVENIYNLLIKIIKDILENDNFSKYPKMKAIVYEKSLELINNHKNIVNEKIEELIQIEIAYMWTECETFHKTYKELICDEKIQLMEQNVVENIKNIINIYFTTVKNTFKNIIPKTIMLHLVNNVMKNINYTLTENINNNNLLDLLKEDNTIYEKRLKLQNEKKNIEDIKSCLD